jgi:hypothetical protein
MILYKITFNKEKPSVEYYAASCRGELYNAIADWDAHGDSITIEILGEVHVVVGQAEDTQ